VYLHGHSAGGTNPSLVEAMYLELPIFAYAVPYNLETTEHKAAYFHTADELLKLVKAMDDKSLKEYALNMYKIAQRRYLWKDIALEYEKLF